jgi:type II secretory pathway pseudopilin PulG
VQEAELELLLLQQTHEKVVLQQEAARVARELDQQQLLVLLQQQQQAAQQEQVSRPERDGRKDAVLLCGPAWPQVSGGVSANQGGTCAAPGWHLAGEWSCNGSQPAPPV